MPRRHYSYDEYDNAGELGIDPLNGDLEIGIGNGLAIDLDNGDLAIQIAPGIDIDL